MRLKLGAFLVPVLLGSVAPARAVIFAVTADPSYNTNAPSGTLTNSGWQYQGFWDTGQGGCNYLGTPIAPRFFIAAKHVAGTNGAEFAFHGFTYHTVTSCDCPGSDLRVWQVAETFPIYAPLYTSANEVDQGCIVFGRGTQRGDAVVVDGETNGWKWGATDGVQRWGANTLVGIANGGANFGELLACTFDHGGGSNECHLSVGDSSGAMFIQESNTWKLAGIHYSVSDPFISTNGIDGSGFSAAMLDYYGVYVGGDENWQFHTQHSAAAFYSTRISANLVWINSVINFEPGTDLQITGIEAVGDDVQIHFATGTNRRYYVDRRDDPSSGSWTTFTNNITGTGDIMTVIDAGAASLSQRFYRVGLSP